MKANNIIWVGMAIILAAFFLLILADVAKADAPFETNIEVDSPVDTSDKSQPAIAIAKDQTTYVVWDDVDYIYCGRLIAGNTYFNNKNQVTDHGGAYESRNPDIAVDESGTIYVVWNDIRNGDWDIWVSKSIDYGDLLRIIG